MTIPGSAGGKGPSDASAALAGVGERARVAIVARKAIGLGSPGTVSGAVARVHTAEVEPLAARRADSLELATRRAAVAVRGVPVVALLAGLERAVSTGRERVVAERECQYPDAGPPDPCSLPRNRRGPGAGCSHSRGR